MDHRIGRECDPPKNGDHENAAREWVLNDHGIGLEQMVEVRVDPVCQPLTQGRRRRCPGGRAAQKASENPVGIIHIDQRPKYSRYEPKTGRADTKYKGAAPPDAMAPAPGQTECLTRFVAGGLDVVRQADSLPGAALTMAVLGDASALASTLIRRERRAKPSVVSPSR